VVSTRCQSDVKVMSNCPVHPILIVINILLNIGFLFEVNQLI